MAVTPEVERARTVRAGSAFAVVWLAFAVFWVIPGEVAFVGPLMSNGTPLRLLGLVAFGLVVLGFLASDRRIPSKPAAWVVLTFIGFALVAFATGNLRALTAPESAQLDRYVLIVLSASGLSLLTMTVVDSIQRAHRLIGLLAIGAVISVVVASLQFVGVIERWAWVIDAPFLTTVVGSAGVSTRLGFPRVPGTTTSPIEYSVLLALTVPLVIHLAVHARTQLARYASGLAVVVVLGGLLIGFSRSGVLALAAALLVAGVFLSFRQQVGLLVGSALAVTVAVVLVPRVVEAFVQLIVGAEDDYSVQARVEDYPATFEMVEANPWFGSGPAFARGLSSVLDNQWLGTLVRDGVVGVLGLAVLLFGGAALAARTALRHPRGSAGRSLNGAMAAGLVATAVVCGTFDLLSFQAATFAPFLLLGLVGAEAGHAPDRDAPTEVSTSAAPASQESR